MSTPQKRLALLVLKIGALAAYVGAMAIVWAAAVYVLGWPPGWTAVGLAILLPFLIYDDLNRPVGPKLAEILFFRYKD